MTQLICNIIMFAACALAVAYYIIAFMYVDKKMACCKPYDAIRDSAVSWSDYEIKRHNTFIAYLVKILLISVVFTVVCAVTCLLDGLTNENYITIPFLIAIAEALVLAFVFSAAICNLGVKHKLVIFANRGRGTFKYYNKFVTSYKIRSSAVGASKGFNTVLLGVVFGFFAATDLALTIYTIILLAV